MGVSPSGSGRTATSPSRSRPGHACGTTGASSAFTCPSSTGSRDSEKPCMSSEVISGAGPITHFTCAPISERASSSVSTDISSGGRPAEVVHQRDVVARAEMRAQPIDDHGHGGAGAGELDLLDPRLAVDAEPELGAPGRDPVLLGRARHGAGVERHADRDRARHHPLGGGGDGLEVRPLPPPSSRRSCGRTACRRRRGPAAGRAMPRRRRR